MLRKTWLDIEFLNVSLSAWLSKMCVCVCVLGVILDFECCFVFAELYYLILFLLYYRGLVSCIFHWMSCLFPVFNFCLVCLMRYLTISVILHLLCYFNYLVCYLIFGCHLTFGVVLYLLCYFNYVVCYLIFGCDLTFSVILHLICYLTFRVLSYIWCVTLLLVCYLTFGVLS